MVHGYTAGVVSSQRGDAKIANSSLLSLSVARHADALALDHTRVQEIDARRGEARTRSYSYRTLALPRNAGNCCALLYGSGTLSWRRTKYAPGDTETAVARFTFETNRVEVASGRAGARTRGNCCARVHRARRITSTQWRCG